MLNEKYLEKFTIEVKTSHRELIRKFLDQEINKIIWKDPNKDYEIIESSDPYKNCKVICDVYKREPKQQDNSLFDLPEKLFK